VNNELSQQKKKSALTNLEEFLLTQHFLHFSNLIDMKDSDWQYSNMNVLDFYWLFPAKISCVAKPYWTSTISK